MAKPSLAKLIVKKAVASAKAQAPKAADDDANDDDDAAEVAMSDVIAGVKSGDSKAAASALRSFLDVAGR